MGAALPSHNHAENETSCSKVNQNFAWITKQSLVGRGPIVRPLGWRSSGEFYPVEFLILGISRPRAKYGTT